MKILFLDVDGVLNTYRTKERVGSWRGLDPVLVSRLINWLVENSEVKVVLSSTWRTTENLTEALRSAGVSWIGETPLVGLRRGQEIDLWLKHNPGVTHFAILDDISDVTPHTGNLVRTSEEFGVQDRHLRKIESLLDLTKARAEAQ